MYPIYTHDQLSKNKKYKQFSVATDKGISSKLAQSKGGGRGR